MWQSVQKKDWKDLEFHLSPTFVGVTGSGQALDRSGWLEFWKVAGVQDFTMGEVEVHPAGADMVVTFVLRLSPATQVGAGENQVYRVVSSWQQLKGGWTLIATSLTPIRSN